MNLDVFLQDERVRMVCKMYPTKTMIGTTQQKQPDEIDDLGGIHDSSLSVVCIYIYIHIHIHIQIEKETA